MNSQAKVDVHQKQAKFRHLSGSLVEDAGTWSLLSANGRWTLHPLKLIHLSGPHRREPLLSWSCMSIAILLPWSRIKSMNFFARALESTPPRQLKGVRERVPDSICFSASSLRSEWRTRIRSEFQLTFWRHGRQGRLWLVAEMSTLSFVSRNSLVP